MNPLSLVLWPVRAPAAALDDIHALGVLARSLTATEPRLGGVDLARLADDVHELSEVAQALPGIERTVIDVERSLTQRVDELEARINHILELAERVETVLPSVTRILDGIEQLGTSAAILATAVEPLQSTAERLARVADLLPGGVRPAASRPA